jgi:hypothetical protein
VAVCPPDVRLIVRSNSGAGSVAKAGALRQPGGSGNKEAAMMEIVLAIGGCIAIALVGRAIATTAQRMRSWYRGSVQGSAVELVVLAALVGGVLGELYRRMRP